MRNIDQEAEEVVLSGLPVVRAGSMPSNAKQEDSLLNKTEMTRGDCRLLARICRSYMSDYGEYPTEHETIY